MAKQIFENARLIEVHQSEKDGYKNAELRVMELGKNRMDPAAIRVKPEEASGYKRYEGHVIPRIEANVYNKSGVSAKGKAYAFTEYSLTSFQPPAPKAS